jgi:hypothetical protein
MQNITHDLHAVTDYNVCCVKCKGKTCFGHCPKGENTLKLAGNSLNTSVKAIYWLLSASLSSPTYRKVHPMLKIRLLILSV